MKKRTISKIKSLFGSKKAKRQLQQQQSSKSSRSPSPEVERAASLNDTFRPLPRTPPPTRAGPPPSPPVPTHPVAPVAPEPSAPLPLLPCQVCGRTFVPQSLAKHVKICEKMTVKKRKTFDSSRQRREGLTPDGVNCGTDLEQYLPKNFGLPENSPFLEKSPPNTAKVTPKPKTQSIRSAITKPMAELQKCPYCARAFGPRAFERHVEWCADKAKILPVAPTAPPPHLADAKLRLHARTQYKAPPVRTRRSSQSRDKTSNSRSASVDSSRGVSPPREHGDYKHGRTRASESLSSNDCPDDPSPHIPVIRNSRSTQKNSTGDANVKARQARLARDISSSRKPQERYPSSPVQQSKTEPNIRKFYPECRNKQRNKLSINKQQKLTKIEDNVNKFKEQTLNKRNNVKTVNKIAERSQIPIHTKINRNEPIRETRKQNSDTNICEESSKDSESVKHAKDKSNKAIPDESKPTINIKKKYISGVKSKESTVRINKTQKTNKLVQESSLRLDSLEESLPFNNEKKCHSIGINTELICPCIPCIIYEYPEQKKSNKRKINNGANVKVSLEIDRYVSEPKIELLYKNLAIVCSSDLQLTVDSEMELHSHNKEPLAVSHITPFATASDCENVTSNNTQFTYQKRELQIENKDIYQIKYLKNLRKRSSNSDENCCKITRDHSAKNFEDEIDISSFENYDGSNDNKSFDNNVGRHGSSDTFTKFTENPHDLEEFINITNTMISNETEEKKFDVEMDIENLLTPKTNSIEDINKDISNNVFSEQDKCNVSDVFAVLKNNLKELLGGSSKNEINKYNRNMINVEEIHESRKVCDLEHITVYELKHYEQIQREKIDLFKDVSVVFKLPSISDNNKSEKTVMCNKKRMQRIYRANRKYNMLSHQSRGNTFIVKKDHEDSDNQSATSEAPPLKLPRITLKSSNNIVSESLFPSSVKRSTSLLDSIQRKNAPKGETVKNRNKVDQLEQDIMQSLKDLDKFYEPERNENNQTPKETAKYNTPVHNGTAKRMDTRIKSEKKIKKNENICNGNYTPNGKTSNDSAYSRLVSLNRISPSKLSLCNSKEPNGITSLEQIPAGLDSSGSHKEDVRSVSSEEFLAMERSAEIDETLSPLDMHTSYKELDSNTVNEKRANSRTSWRRCGSGGGGQLSSSGSEASLQRREAVAPRFSRFCHECGSKFPVDTAKFCIECGVKRLLV
ncbi:repetitive organellar protein [Achroia grisella]|uniref:repetitive organellar protein n=1 Tax=Achroia grisella TaxID=688607 RepID=UPI0027D2AD2E|nr:repetitive organellar protein [Achroia grisella]